MLDKNRALSATTKPTEKNIFAEGRNGTKANDNPICSCLGKFINENSKARVIHVKIPFDD